MASNESIPRRGQSEVIRKSSQSGSGSGSLRSGAGGSGEVSGERIGPNAKYERCRHLGSGNFGDAWLVRSTQSFKNYVVKELKMTSAVSKKDYEQVFNEVKIIKRCCHVNIIRYKDFFISQTPTGVHILSIVMEYADAGDLQEFIKRHIEIKVHLEEKTIRYFFVQICFALSYLHKNQILHRDLKSQNIFMTSSKLLKLGDFGISKTLSHENDFATTGIGTPQYLSPEICRQQKYDYKSDIWSLGCVLYELCALSPAFPGRDLPTLIYNIVRGVYKPIPSHYSVSLTEMIKVLLRPDPSRRPTADQVLTAKVLHGDLRQYMSIIDSLSDKAEKGRTNSSSSVDEDRASHAGGTGSSTASGQKSLEGLPSVLV